MNLKWKVIVAVNIIFILFVSFKIIQPEIEELENEEKADHLAYTSSPKLKERRQLLQILDDKFLLKSEYCKAGQDPWKIASDWVKDREIIPEDAPELGCVLHSLKSARILAADVGIKGTQLKVSLVLEGGQVVAFKPKWYARDWISPDIVAGRDRHNGEIAAFHLGRLLDFRRIPIAVGRRINLKTDIIPVASKRLLKTFVMKGSNQCFYGKCMYCWPEEPVCADGDVLEGVVILWLPRRYEIEKLASPWMRSYKPNVTKRWEIDESYCDKLITSLPYKEGPRLMDIVDAAILDFLVGNGDRHHFEYFKGVEQSVILIMDNGKSFGNPNRDEASILAPLRQCCRIRQTTWHSMLILQDKVLSSTLRKILDQDSIAPVLLDSHYNALDRRLKHILAVVQGCIATNGQDKVFITDKTAMY